jgi:adenylate cyclase class 2
MPQFCATARGPDTMNTMPAGRIHREIEIKLRLSSVEEGRERLDRTGFRIVRPRAFEQDSLFDTPEKKLREAGALLRIRRRGAEGLLTYKGPAQKEKHKSREEIETGIADAEVLAGIFLRLGFEVAFRYEKYRTEYGEPGRAGLATLDETPIGDFLELEGDPEWIDDAARRLGFAEPAYITASYATLYREFRATNPQAPANMLFPNGAEK